MDKRKMLMVMALALVGFGGDDQISGVGTDIWSVGVAVTTTSRCIPRFAGESICALFPMGPNAKNRVVMVQTRDTAVTCAFVGYVGRTEDGTNGIDLDASTLNIDDNALTTCGPSGSAACNTYGDGPGSVMRAELPNSYEQGHPDWTQCKAFGCAGTRTGVCSNPPSSLRNASNEPLIYATCGQNSDCTNYGGGTCLHAPTAGALLPESGRYDSDHAANVGSQLVCKCVTGTCNVTVKKQWVLK